MDRRAFLRAAGAIGGVVVSGCPAGDDAPALTEGFEDGIGAWEPGAAIGPEVELAEFDWAVTGSTTEAATGERSLEIWNEGDFDDGVTWATHPVPVEPGRTYTATVTASIWSESESFNTIRDALMRLAPTPPAAEADFPDPGVNTTTFGETPVGGLREPLWLEAGWREYRFEWRTPRLSTDELSLAVGTAVIWEGDATHYVDEIRVELQSRE